MSIIYSIIFTLFLASIISALIAPADIYSAVICNTQNSPIQCNVIWSNPFNGTLQIGSFTIEKNQKYVTDEQNIDMGDWKARAVIQEIQCGTLVLAAPFNGVHSPKTKWEFFVTPTEIVSNVFSSQLVISNCSFLFL